MLAFTVETCHDAPFVLDVAHVDRGRRARAARRRHPYAGGGAGNATAVGSVGRRRARASPGGAAQRREERGSRGAPRAVEPPVGAPRPAPDVAADAAGEPRLTVL